ncbi:helix-turn-helix transcriptional regulator [uncultured Muribaculum sp.]|uniref:helix-turn-helix transcriptional regulator n=1 Tax=uncultured Muribaculum sp. TaxID=1918613 RepID=UPI00262C96FC|nr:helix-turn-helix transcriptional regulator [uncultured Muribaculum sp.]
MGKCINRLKVVLAEQRKTNIWLARELGKDPATVSKWCTNTAQPSLETFYEIAECLKVDIRTLLNPNESVTMVAEPTEKYGA